MNSVGKVWYDKSVAWARGTTLHEFVGQDRLMAMTTAERHVMCVSVRVPENVGERALVERVKQSVEHRLESDGPASVLRARVYEPNPLLYYFSEEPSTALADQMVASVATPLEAGELTRRLVQARLPVLWIVHKNGYYCAASHQFVDGCRFADLASVPLDSSVVDWSLVPGLDCMGLLAGVGALPGLYRQLTSMHRNLPMDPPGVPPRRIEQRHQLSHFKEMKQYLCKRHGRFPLSLVVCLVSCLQLFRGTGAGTLNVCLLGGVHPKNSPCFNNVRHAYIQVRRPSTDRSTLDIFHTLAEQLHDFAQTTAASQSIASYIGAHAYPVVAGLLGAVGDAPIDCAVSLAPTSLPALYNGAEAHVESLFYAGAAAPGYHMWHTSSQSIVCMSVIRSPDMVPDPAWSTTELLDAVYATSRGGDAPGEGCGQRA
jgi:hypothetical protein